MTTPIGAAVEAAMRDANCKECDGAGWLLDYLGGCGDPECCGGHYKVRCPFCDNDWEIGDDDAL